MREIIIDCFAGGGGASVGIEIATGRIVDIAINHDPMAIAMHKVNHPGTKHYCENIWEVDPKEAAAGRSVALAWFSPDCKHFSKAKGGKPVEKKIRGLAWVVVRWAATVKPRVIILENVEEFQTWGPLTIDNRPDPDKKGQTFRSFINALKRQGYHVEWRELKACDYGAPTSRKRLFLIARCDGRPIVWPEPTHCEPDRLEVYTGEMKPYRTAAEIINWSLPCPSIFERKRPLAENTLRRIARGIQKFVIDNPNPFIMQAYGGGYTGSGSDINRPLPTITAKDHNFLVTP
jgi:DNA (cytosine-5)-methyltransferase 1